MVLIIETWEAKMITIPESIHNLIRAGIDSEDAYALRRIAMTLHRWYELERGDGNNHCSWSIERGKRTPNGWECDPNGNPYLLRHWHDGKITNERLPDRERGAHR